MNLNPFHSRGKRGQKPAEVRAERDRLAAELATRAAELATRDAELAAAHANLVTTSGRLATRSIEHEAALIRIDELVVERDWFKDRWMDAGRKVIGLEAIAGEYVDSSTAPEPLFAAVAEQRNGEITREFRALTPGPEPIGPITLVKAPAVAGAGAR